MQYLSRMVQSMAVQFAVLSSGSRGNSTLICGRGAGLLIDVGLGPKLLGERLESVGSSWSRIATVVLTHTHGDHVDSATFNELARRGVTVHCHEGHRAALARDPGFKKLEECAAIRCYDDHPFLVSNGLRLEPIELSHDGGPTFGFRIEASSERREPPVAIGYLADCGCWSAGMAESLADVDLLGVEFNHDVEMQKSSRRPGFLIERNLSDSGHLSNVQGAELLAGHSDALAARCAAPRGSLAPERPVQSTRAGTPGGPRHASSRGPGSPGPRRTPDDCLTQHPAERRPRTHARLRSRRRGTAQPPSQKAAGTEGRNGALTPVSCAGTRTRMTSPRRSSDRGALFRQRRPPAIRSTRSRRAIQQLVEPA